MMIFVLLHKTKVFSGIEILPPTRWNIQICSKIYRKGVKNGKIRTSPPKKRSKIFFKKKRIFLSLPHSDGHTCSVAQNKSVFWNRNFTPYTMKHSNLVKNISERGQKWQNTNLTPEKTKQKKLKKKTFFFQFAPFWWSYLFCCSKQKCFLESKFYPLHDETFKFAQKYIGKGSKMAKYEPHPRKTKQKILKKKEIL